MRRLLYSLATLLALPWAVAHLLWRARRQPDYLRHWGERFGHFSPRPAQPPTIWLHAVSVGETRAAQPLVAALRERYPEHRILFTHMTPTGRATSQALFGDTVERIYLPYDTPWAMRRFLRHYRPRFGCILETELWPNLLTACARQRVPVLLVNARLSERSARRYARFAELTRQALHCLTAIGAQSADDAARLAALGAQGTQTLVVTGNLKFDSTPPPAQLALGEVFRARIGQRPVWLAASTREGEEALILAAWKKAVVEKVGADETAIFSATEAISVATDTTPAHVAPLPLLILVPRHPQRFDEVAQLAIQQGFVVQKRSEDAPVAATTHVLLGDSMGEMFAWYVAADLAFIGGSLKDYGCQNLIEACAVGAPVLLGPSTFNFAEAAREALACGAAHSIADADDLARQVMRLLADDAQRQRMSEAARDFAARHRGATARTLALIDNALSQAGR
jgi:3-deoxy-D-manno-octulosonic-acid transferase